MLETFLRIRAPGRRLRSGPAGPYLDDFARWLRDNGYRASAARRHLRTANWFARWGKKRKLRVEDLDEATCKAFCRHLGRRRHAKPRPQVLLLVLGNSLGS